MSGLDLPGRSELGGHPAHDRHVGSPSPSAPSPDYYSDGWQSTGPQHTPAPGGVAPTGRDMVDQFMEAIAQVESGGAYDAKGPHHPEMGYPLGRYQIMESNWPTWAAEAGVPGADWTDPAAQDAVARHKFLEYYDQYGSWDAVAVAWFAGPGMVEQWQQDPSSLSEVSDSLGTDVPQYVSAVLGHMDDVPVDTVAGVGGAGQEAAAGATFDGAGVGVGPAGVQEQEFPWDSIEEAAKDMYPYLSVYLDHEELGPILREAAENQWSADRTQAAIQDTDWFRHRTESERDWEHMLETQPAEAESHLATTAFEIERMAIEEFGQTALTDEDFRELAEASIVNDWSEGQLRQAVRAHEDFVHMSEPEQQFYAQMWLNPAEVQSQVERIGASVRQQADELGVPLTDSEMTSLASDVLRYGWSDAQITEELTSRIDFSQPENLTGEAGRVWRGIEEVGQQYLIDISEGTRRKWASKITSGEMTMEDWEAYARDHAKSRYPALANALDRGFTVQEYAEPYRQTVAQTLEMNPQDIDLQDQRFRPLLDGVDHDGERRPMPLWQAERYARGLDEYQYTDQAHQQASELTQTIGQMFGQVA